MKKKLQMPATILVVSGAAIMLYNVFSSSETNTLIRSIGYLCFFAGLALAFGIGMFTKKNQASK